MKKIILVCFIMAVCRVCCGVEATNIEYRIWSGKNGSRLEARYVRYDGDSNSVVFQDKNSKEYKAKFDNLSDLDKEYVSSLLLKVERGIPCETGEKIVNGERLLTGECEIVRAVSISEYLFMCRLSYQCGTTNMVRKELIEESPKLRSDIGTFASSRIYGTRRLYRTITERVPNMVEKLVIVKGIPWAESQFRTYDIGFPSPSGGYIHSYSTSGKSYKGVFRVLHEEYKFKGNLFPLMEYSSE